MHIIKDRIRSELRELGEKPHWNASDMEALKILTDAHKDVICAEKEEEEARMLEELNAESGYSEKRHYVRGHYSAAGMRDGWPMRHDYPDYSEKRDSRGRYSSDGDGMTMQEHLEAALQRARPEDRETLQHMLNKVR